MAPLNAWEEYLASRLSFPFEAEVAEFQESGPFRGGDHVQVVRISQVVDLYGVMVHVQVKGGHYNFALCDLQVVDRRSPNHQILDDYAVWFANR